MKVISLAISEAFAGSDVAGLRTKAVKSEDGKSWTINGTKKWISGGMHSDYFVRSLSELSFVLVLKCLDIDCRRQGDIF